MRSGTMKNAIALLLSAAIMLSLAAGCSSTEGAGTPSPSPSNSAPAESPAASTDPSELQELGSGDVKWSEEKTADGWMRVTNENGATLGYSPDSGVKLLQSDGFAFKDMNK